jgi:hypothetical protein
VYAGKPDEGNGLANIDVLYSVGDDSGFGGPNALWFRLTIKNVSPDPVNGCRLVLNDRYRAELSALFFDRGFFRGTLPFGSSTIPPKTTLDFLFSHDTSNHNVFLDTDNELLPRDIRPATMMLECREGIGRWKFD